MMAIDELKDYLENGNITHSVNYPDLQAGIKNAKYRICINHKNIPGMIANFSKTIVEAGGNIQTLLSKSKGDFAYTVIDVDTEIDINVIKAMDGILRVRVI